jgi:hypothetical protein
MDLEFEFDLIELRLTNLENLIIANRFNTVKKHDFLVKTLDTSLPDLIANELNESREFMVKRVKKHLDYLLSSINNSLFEIKNENASLQLSAQHYLHFVDSELNLGKNQTFLIHFLDHLFNRSYLYLKNKYLNLFSSDAVDIMASIKTVYQLNNLNYINEFKMIVKVNRIVLSDKRIFYFVENRNKACFMLITNQHNILVIRSSIINLRHFEHYQFIGNGNFIVALFYDDHSYLVKLFDLNLKQLKMRVFDNRINLHSMNKNEIVCFTNKIKSDRYLILNFDLDVVKSFGQKIDSKKPFYFGDSSLIQCSLNRIFIYFYDIFRQNHSVKILNRLTGSVERNLVLKDTKYQFIKLDSSSRLLIKSGSADGKLKLSYHDSNGDHLFEVKCDDLINDIGFDFTSNDMLFSWNQNRVRFI